MPIFEYECRHCGHRFEHLVLHSSPAAECPACQNKDLVLGSAVLFVCVQGAAQNAAAQRALLDQYCVTCHNDKTRTANFSLQKEDINSVADHPEVWERVIRKLRAGMMPPPGMPRPP